MLLLLSFANGMPGPEDTLLERAFSLAIAGTLPQPRMPCIRCMPQCMLGQCMQGSGTN